MKLTRLRVALIGLALLLALASPMLSAVQATSPVPLKVAAAPSLTMEVKAGFDSYYKEHAWLPVQVTLVLAAGQASFQGRIEASISNFAEGTQLVRRVVQLSPPARKTYWLFLNEVANVRQIQVRLISDSNEQIGAPTNVDVNPLSDGNLLMGVISDDGSALNYLNNVTLGRESLGFSAFILGHNFYASGYSNSSSITNTGSSKATVPVLSAAPRVTVAHLAFSDLPPNGTAWSALNSLVVTDLTTTNLSGDQGTLQTAMAAWLVQGGALFGAGDSALRRAPFLRDFLPTNAGSLPPAKNFLSASLTELQRYTQSGQPLPAGTLQVADVPVNSLAAGSQVLLQQDNTLLLAKRPYGLGQSWLFTTDLRPLRNWDGAASFWSAVFQNYSVRDSYTASAHRSRYEFGSLSYLLTPSPNTPKLPDPGWFALFLLVYIAAIGPVNYLVLRRLDRRELTWLTVPVLTLIFSLGAYSVSTLSTISDIVASRVAIVSLGQGSDGKLRGANYGLESYYSSNRTDFNLNIAEESLANGVFDFNSSGSSNNKNDLTPIIQQGAGGNLGQVHLGIRTSRSFAFENDANNGNSGSATNTGGETAGVRAQLKIVGDHLEGSLENTDNKDWNELVLVLPDGNVQKVGSLKPGEKRNVDATMPPRKTNNLTQNIVGVSNYFLNTNSNSGYPAGPQSYYTFNSQTFTPQRQKAIVLETLIGVNGEGLLTDPGRFYLIAWRDDAKSPLATSLSNIQNYNLTLLFEALSAEK